MYRHFFKRGFDLFLAILALPFWIIILLIVAPLIYLEDKGTVFYSVDRLGKNGKPFKMYKFRTMKMNAPDLRNKDTSTFNSKDDKRITKIGKILRNTSIDETPQILNILKNEMSLIGPRPDLPEHISCYQDQEKRKLEVLPGVTGYNQAYYRNCVEWKERLANDVYYVEHLSLWLDVKVFIKTIECIILRKGIYSMPIPNKDNSYIQSGINYDCTPLDWDTEYFGIPSARVTLKDAVNEEHQEKILGFCNNFEFITICNLGNDKENNQWIGKKTKAFLTDINVQFIRMVEKEPEETDDSCEVFHSYPADEKILHLAQKAFIYSRFWNDSKLSGKQALDIYYQWTKNAFEKENKYFVVAKRKEETAGYILFSIDQESSTATIELIAVDIDFREQRVGKSLISKMESFVFENGIHKIKVGTQADNIAAIQFYTGVGFRYVGCNTVYHLWNQV